jgi:3D (Asp-Asp-Asp) domain-containing protein
MKRLVTLAVLGSISMPAQAEAVLTEMGATAYCLQGTMADGTYTRARSAAANHLPLGTKIRLVGRPFLGGMRRFVVRDRIGWGTSLDLWTPSCGSATYWGRRGIRYKLGWGKP